MNPMNPMNPGNPQNQGQNFMEEMQRDWIERGKAAWYDEKKKREAEEVAQRMKEITQAPGASQFGKQVLQVKPNPLAKKLKPQTVSSLELYKAFASQAKKSAPQPVSHSSLPQSAVETTSEHHPFRTAALTLALAFVILFLLHLLFW